MSLFRRARMSGVARRKQDADDLETLRPLSSLQVKEDETFAGFSSGESLSPRAGMASLTFPSQRLRSS